MDVHSKKKGSSDMAQKSLTNGRKDQSHPTDPNKPYRILEVKTSRTGVIKQTFEIFECEEPKITIGIDINILHTMLKLVSDDDPITFYIMSNNRDTLYISG